MGGTCPVRRTTVRRPSQTAMDLREAYRYLLEEVSELASKKMTTMMTRIKRRRRFVDASFRRRGSLLSSPKHVKNKVLKIVNVWSDRSGIAMTHQAVSSVKIAYSKILLIYRSVFPWNYCTFSLELLHKFIHTSIFWARRTMSGASSIISKPN